MADEVEEVTEVDESVAEEVEEGAPNAPDDLADAGEVDITATAVEAPPGARVAKVYLCERGHRTMTLWGKVPEVCQARPTRHGGVCGLPIYHMTELPEQVQKALNPLKASKKKAGKK